MMNHARVAIELTRLQRNILIAHVDGSNDVPVAVRAAEMMNSRTVLVAKGLVRFDQQIRPTKTFITDDGRQVLAHVLAEYAEALLRAGYTGLSSPLGERARPIAVPSAGHQQQALTER